MKVGLFLSTEEYSPAELVEQAQRAADGGMREVIPALTSP
jgi:hypothetical protein